jgi:hypothetical protein
MGINQKSFKDNISRAFESLFDETSRKDDTPWDRCRMSREEWTKVYQKACEEHHDFLRQCEQGKFYNEEA